MKQSLPKFINSFLMFFFVCATAWAQNSAPFEYGETFENLGLTGNQYRDGYFVGNNGITWTYTHVTGEQSFPINEAGLLLRRSGENSNIKSDLIPGGISNFQVLMRKAFTGTGDRQIGLFINDQLIAQSITFGGLSGGSEEIFTFTVDNINVAGDFTLEIRHLTGGTNNRQLVIDDISWNTFDGTVIERVAAPQFSPESGLFTSPQNINLSSDTENASIYYTLDGSNPTSASNLYSSPIEISSTTIIKAVAIKEGMNESDVSEAEYIINIPDVGVADIPYQQDFSQFRDFTGDVTTFGERQEWTFSANVLEYQGEFGAGTAGGFRGNGVLGYQHTGSSGIMIATLIVTNNTFEPIQDLKISYLGKTERNTQTRFPAFTVNVNGTSIPELGYSTEEGEDRLVSHVLSGLNILPGQEVEISWSSDRGLTTTGSSRQIGIADVSVTPVVSEGPITNIENFDNLTLGTGYTNNSFVGNAGITWTFVASRNEGTYPIDGNGLMLRATSFDSKITSSPISGGIGSFKVDMRKAFTGNAPRQIALYVNGEEIAQSEVFGDFSGGDATIRTFEVNDINLGGDIIIEIRNLTEGQITIDNITWTPFDDNIPPVIESLSPANGSQEIDRNTDLSITFDERISKGQGNISLYDMNGTLIQTVDVTSDKVSIERNVATISISELVQAATYYILVDAGAFEDLFTNQFAGVQDNDQWVFTTFDPNAPVLSIDRGILDDFGRVRNGEVSAIQSITLTLNNVTSPINVVAPVNFEVATNGDFSNELILDPISFEAGEIDIQVRFSPNSGSNQTIEGDMIISSEGAVSRAVSLIGEEIGNQISIGEARLLPNGTEVFVEGIVVAGNTLNADNRWIQDETGGILLRAFANTSENEINRSSDLQIGDRIRVSGTLATFNQNIQISAGSISMERIASGETLPEPLLIAISEMNDPSVQGRLVRVNNITLVDSRFVFEGAGAAGSYAITGQTDSRLLRIPTADHPLVGLAIPDKGFDIVGIIDRFNAVAQINPRIADDLILEKAAGSIEFSGSNLNLGVVPSGQVSATSTYTFMVNQPSADINLTVVGPFEISADGENFVTALTLNGLSVSTQEIAVRFVPTADANGIRNGLIIHTGEQIYRSIVQLRGIESGNTTSIPYAQSFNTTDLFSAQGWTDYSVKGGQTWQITAEGTGLNNAGRAVQMNGFSNGAQLNENWLISPLFDLNTDQFPVLSFYSRGFFAGPRLQLKASSNYDGFSDPTSPEFTWVALEDKFAASTGSFVLADNIDLSDFINGKLHLAFIYTSDPEFGAAEWRIDNFDIRIQAEQPRNLILDVGPLSNMHFGIIDPGQSSALKSFNFTATGLTDAVTLSIASPFKVSKDGVNFSEELTFLPGESFRSAIKVKYAPTAVGIDVASIKLTTEGEATTYGRFTGSTTGKENTFDVVTWNIEWFGSTEPNQGPNNVNLQLQNVKTIIEELDADVYAFQEITDLNKYAELVDALPGYRGFFSTAVSEAGGFDGAQKLTYLYKTATVDSISSRVLLKDVNPADLVNYPGPTNRFWASGRLPFLFDIKAKIQGVEQNITLVNVHTRSNGGGESAANQRYAMRKYDVGVLKDSLDKYYSDVALIILGDYNDDLDETVADQSAPTVNTSETSFIRYINDSTNYTPATISLSNAGLRTFIAFENVIDHMIVTNEMSDNWLIGSERVVIPFDLVQNYQNTTSDHLPVKVRFQLKCKLEAGIVSASETEVCEGSNLVELNLISGVYDSILGWEVSEDSGESWAIIEGSEGKDKLTVVNIETNSLFRAIIDASTCNPITSEPIEVSVVSLPTPTLNFAQGKLVTTQGNYTYSWYKDGLFIESTSINEIQFKGAGSYQVEIINAEGCSTRSEIFSFPPAANQGAYKVYPNPTNRKFFVSINDVPGRHSIELRNPMGLPIKTLITNGETIEFDVSGLQAGVYLVHITESHGTTIIERLLVR